MKESQRIHHASPHAERGTEAVGPSRAPRARPRVLIASSTLHIGGAERVIACLASHLNRDLFDVTACYLKENGVVGDEMRQAGVDLVPIPGLVPGRPDRWSFLKLRRLLRERRIQIIHTHDIHGLMDASACRLIMPGLRHIHTFHYGYPPRPYQYERVERVLWRVPDQLVAVGEEQALAIQRLYGIPAERLHVLRNGVDRKDAIMDDSLQALVANVNVPVIASISTLIEQKSIPTLLEAAGMLRGSGEQFLLLIAGHGHLRDELERQAEALSLGASVRFLGWVNEASRRVLPLCDIFVQSSIWEAMSVVVLEAMAAGKPVVVTRTGDNHHVVSNGETGLVVPPADAGALAEALRKLIRDPELRARYGAAGQQRHAGRYKVENMVRAHEQLYLSVAA